jgi:hypothetical protein
VAIWAIEDTAAVDLHVDGALSSVDMYSMTGERSSRSVSDGAVNLDLTTAPVYVVFETPDDDGTDDNDDDADDDTDDDADDDTDDDTDDDADDDADDDTDDDTDDDADDDTGDDAGDDADDDDTPSTGRGEVTFDKMNTNSATINTVLKVIELQEGSTLFMGTRNMASSGTAWGDTFIRLYNPQGKEVAVNDNYQNGSNLSYLDYTVPGGLSGPYEIQIGCFKNKHCYGALEYLTIFEDYYNGFIEFGVTDTNSATSPSKSANSEIFLQEGQTIRLGTCNLDGADGIGDTFLRFYGPDGYQVAENNDSCEQLSYLEYTVPVKKAGRHEVRIGCYYNNSCSGTVAYEIEN